MTEKTVGSHTQMLTAQRSASFADIWPQKNPDNETEGSSKKTCSCFVSDSVLRSFRFCSIFYMIDVNGLFYRPERDTILLTCNT